MEIKGKVHCFFEQSGTFKNEFIKLGYEAYDYDIQNNFGETDYVMDLFGEIDGAYEGMPSVFDMMTKDDLIVAFFPCIYFCEGSMMAFRMDCVNYRCLGKVEKIKKIFERNRNRNLFYEVLLKFVYVVMNRSLRMVFENPWSQPHFLNYNFLKPPTVIDPNRMERGDFYKKPTAYWFWNCEPTHGFTHQNDKPMKTIRQSKGASRAGLCSEERSMISSDYARNWICDFILGKYQEDISGPTLFDMNEIDGRTA